MHIEKVQKVAADLHYKNECVIHIRNLKHSLNHGLVFKKVDRVIKFSEDALLKPHIDMNNDIIKKAKNDLEKDFFKSMNKAVFGESI